MYCLRLYVVSRYLVSFHVSNIQRGPGFINTFRCLLIEHQRRNGRAQPGHPEPERSRGDPGKGAATGCRARAAARTKRAGAKAARAYASDRSAAEGAPKPRSGCRGKGRRAAEREATRKGRSDRARRAQTPRGGEVAAPRPPAEAAEESASGPRRAGEREAAGESERRERPRAPFRVGSRGKAEGAPEALGATNTWRRQHPAPSPAPQPGECRGKRGRRGVKHPRMLFPGRRQRARKQQPTYRLVASIVSAFVSGWYPVRASPVWTCHQSEVFQIHMPRAASTICGVISNASSSVTPRIPPNG